MAIKDRFRNIPLPEIVEESILSKAQSDNLFVDNSIDINETYEELIKALSLKITSIPVWFEYSKEEQHKLISSYVSTKLSELEINFSEEDKERFVKLFMNSVFGFGALDILLLKDDVSTIIVSSDGLVEIEKNGIIELSDIMLEENQFNKIKNSLLSISQEKSEIGIVNLKLENLLITIILPPVCDGKIIFRKLERDSIDFNFLISEGMVSFETAELIKSFLKEKKNILIVGKLSSGKSALLSAMLNEIKDERTALVQCSPIIPKLSRNIESFFTSSLNENEVENLLSSILVMKPLFFFADLNSCKNLDLIMNLCSATLSGFVSSIIADSVTSAIYSLASICSYRERCTEKLAKANIANIFDYILFLENKELKSISTLSLNKSGSLVVSNLPLPESVHQSEEAQNVPAQECNQNSSEFPSRKDYSSFRSRYQ